MRSILVILTAWVSICLASAPTLAQEPAPLGNQTCKICHVPHEGHKVNVYHSDCLVCHTPETKHLTEGGRGSVKLPAADNCLSCHAEQRPQAHELGLLRAQEGQARMS